MDDDTDAYGAGFAEEALGNWTPRFVAHGLNAKDLDEIRGSLESWRDWCGAFSRMGARHLELGDAALERDRTESFARHYTQGAMYYHFASYVWHVDDDERDAAHRRAVEAFGRGGQHLDPSVERVDAPTGRGFDLPALLRVPERGPDGEPGPSPLVLMHPGLDSVKEELVVGFSDYFLDRGLATLCIDGPGQGEAWYHHAMTPDYAEFVSPAIDHVQAEAPHGVDTDRLGIMGISLGGFYAPLVAANDDRIDACVGLSGRLAVGPVSAEASGLHAEQYKWACKTDDMDEVDEITAAMTLEGCIDDLTCPAMMMTGSEDTIVLPEETREIAERSPGAEYVEIEGANHVCVDRAYRAFPYMADWMRERLT